MLVACPKCQRTFPAEEGSFCPEDATALKPIAEVPAPRDEAVPLLGHLVADRYEVRRVVAEGSMGRVYEAHDQKEDRRAAVKILHPQVADDNVNIERFRREASTSKELDHAYIVDVYDFASVPGVPGRAKKTWYLAMEYLDGEELRGLLKREKRLSVARTLRIVSQVALALDPAHAAGFVHRDMKPDNVFLVKDGHEVRVKLLDFGSVKFTKGQDRGNKLTVLGTTIGSPFYMAPEQAQGLPDLDHRADVWAVVAIAYEMLVGRVPFNGSNGPQILFRILSDEPEPPTFVDDTLPPALDAVLLQGLKKKPDDRYATVGAFADALGRAFGLEGDHKTWAVTPQAALAEKLPSSQAPPPVPSEKPEAPKTPSMAPPPVVRASEKPVQRTPEEAAAKAAVDEPDVSSLVKPAPAVPLPALVAAAVLVAALVVYFGFLR
ncbi:MAG: protein kinase [Polyangiales bacterium]